MHRADPDDPCLTTANWDEKVSFQNPVSTFTFESFQQKNKAGMLKGQTPCVCLYFPKINLH